MGIKKIFIIIFFALFFLNKAQISIKATYLEKVENNTYFKHKLKIDIINNSSKTIVLPIDTTQLRGYFQDENCVDLKDKDFNGNLRFVALMDIHGILEDAYAGINKNHDINDYKRTINTINKREIEKKKKLRKWKIKYKINESDDWIEKNEYLFKNLMILHALQKKTYIIYFEPYKMDCDEYCESFYYYYLKNNSLYNFSVNYCIDKEIYNFLTKKQLFSFKNYELFSGTLKSNSVSWMSE